MVGVLNKRDSVDPLVYARILGTQIAQDAVAMPLIKLTSKLIQVLGNQDDPLCAGKSLKSENVGADLSNPVNALFFYAFCGVLVAEDP